MYKFFTAVVLVLSSRIVSADEKSIDWFLGLGVWFGGELVEINPDGDNYDAGSGAVLDFGIDFQINEKTPLYWKSSAGFRYQGAKSGKGENQGVVLETSLFHKVGMFSYGGGLHADILSYTSDYFGEKTKFKNEIGPFIYVNYHLEQGIGVGFKYHFLDYQSKNGTDFDGNQYGVFLELRY